MSTARYEVRKNPDNQYWTVYHTKNDAPAFIGDMPMDRLVEVEAQDVLELINAALLRPAKSAGE